MGLDLSNLATNSAVTEIEFWGETTKITYRPAIITTERLAEMDKPLPKGSKDEDDSRFLQFFCELILDWDVKKSGKKVPLQEKSLRAVPLPFLRAVYFHCLQDAASGEAARPSSDG